MSIHRLILSRRAWKRATPFAVVALLALVPISMVARQVTARPSLSPGSAVTMLFSGPGWQDKVLTHEGYVAPPKELADAVLAPRQTNVTLSNVSPDKKWFLNEMPGGATPMSIFGLPFDELGGVFIDYRANRLRSLTLRNVSGIQIISAADGTKKMVALPPNTRVTGARWTPDGSGIAYLSLGDDSTNVWITDLATNRPRQVTKSSMLTTFVTNFAFVNGGKQIVAVFPPDGRSPRPVRPSIPTGPEIRLSLSGEKDKNRTFPSLMSTPYDFQLLEWHATGQVEVVDVATGAATKFGTPGMITAVDMSPDGRYARVTRMTKPFSYIVPVSAFGSIEEICDGTGKALAKLNERAINLGAVADNLDPLAPQPDPTAAPAAPAAGGGRGAANDNGKRELAWRADGQGMNYLQLDPAPVEPAARGGRAGAGAAGGGRGGRAGAGGRGANAGQAANAAPRKDHLMQWLPPFSDSSTKEIFLNPTRMTGARFSPDGSILFFSENNSTVAVYLADPATKYTIVAGGAGNRGGANGAPANPNAAPAAPVQVAGRGNAGGTLLGVSGGGGAGRGGGGGGGRGGGGGGAAGPVLLSPDGTSVYLEGTSGGGRAGANGPSQTPYLDKVNIKTGERTHLFQGESGDMADRISMVLDPEAKRLVLMKENAKTVPQQFLYDNGTRKQLTENVDLFPDMTNMVVQHIIVTRPDGFHFRTTIDLPQGYMAGTRLPGFFWFYPAEFTSQDQYDGGRGGGGGGAGGQQNFPNFGTLSKQFLVRLGYAVIENDAPIVGPAGEMNDNYVNDLRNDLSATIDELDRRGIIDRQRLAIGGHSYGAFSTVNAMVNTPFFKAGIAGDGNYNRTLTPNGFQNERRDLWQAPDVYLDMSPFLRANHLTGALLMYHDMHDQNVGTDPINSTRLYDALIGMGKTVALYRYPFEDHGPAALETCLDLWSRWAAWLDKYVKNPAPDKPKPAPAARGGGGGR